MPYDLVKEGEKVCVRKKDTGKIMHCYEGENAESRAKRYMRALYAHSEDSAAAIVDMSLVVVKASYEKDEPDPNRKRRIVMTTSDTAPDLYEERMSAELFSDFTRHIENNDPVPEAFREIICEDTWCGGMPYLSIAHYRAGRDGKNVPGEVESVYVDGDRLKSKAFLYDNPLGRRLFDTLCDDLRMHKSGTPNPNPVRVSIGFLDLEHVHEVNGKSVVFERDAPGQVCALCSQGVGGKIYKRGYLVHLAATRVPVNQRTEMSLEEKSMDIVTKKDDAASIVGEDLAEELEEKSLADGVLVVKSDGSENRPQPAPFAGCYDPNTDTFDQDCIDASMRGFMAAIRNEMNAVKSEAVERLYDEVSRSLERVQGRTSPAVEEIMEDTTVTKAKAQEEQEEDEKGKRKDMHKGEMHEEMHDEEKMHKSEASAPAASTLDRAFEELKSVLANAKSVEEVQKAFNALGREVEKSYAPPPAPRTDDLAEAVKSAVEAAIAPLRQELAILKAQSAAPNRAEHPVSRALTLRPEELIRRGQQAEQQLTQIQRIARASVFGAQQ